MSEHHPLIQIVDARDNPLRGGTMDEAQLQGLWHRMVGVMVWDSVAGKFLLQKVKPNRFYSGDSWNLTSSGHVDAGETYEGAALRELREEMGIRGLELVDFLHYTTERTGFSAGKNRTWRRHNKIFIAQADKDALQITPSDEVEAWCWMDLSQLQDDSVPKTRMLARFVRDWVEKNDIINP